jgi:hypothetical protein
MLDGFDMMIQDAMMVLANHLPPEGSNEMLSIAGNADQMHHITQRVVEDR